jgi:hypothetical protein
MSGSNYVSQLVAFDFQAWLPADPLPTIPPNDALNIGLGKLPDVYAPEWLRNVIDAWQPVDPLPTLSAKLKATFGAGSSVAIYAPIWQQTVLASWIPPDPLPTIPVQFGKRFTTPGPPAPVPTPGNKVTPPQNVRADGSVPVYFQGVTPRAALATATVDGAVAAIVGPINGGYIVNPATAAAQGLGATENLYVDMVNPPGNADATAFGTTEILAAGNNPPFTLPPLAAGVTVWVNAPTPGHKFTIVVW